MKELRQDTNRQTSKGATQLNNRITAKQFKKGPNKQTRPKYQRIVTNQGDKQRGTIQEPYQTYVYQEIENGAQTNENVISQNMSYLVQHQFEEGSQIVASAKPILYKAENSKREDSAQDVDTKPLLPSQELKQNRDFLRKQQKSNSGPQVNASSKSLIINLNCNRSAPGAIKKKTRRGRRRQRCLIIQKQTQLKQSVEDGRHLSLQMTQEQVQARLTRDNLAALKDIRLEDQTKNMPRHIQQKLMMDGRPGQPEKYIYAKYCPGAPHNTTQFISYEYNSRLSNCGVQAMLLDSLIQDDLQIISEEGILINKDDETQSLAGGIAQLNQQQICSDADCLSYCSSSSSFNTTKSTSNASSTSKTISLSALEQIGASMEGFVSADMFDDMSLLNLDLNKLSSSSGSENDDYYGDKSPLLNRSLSSCDLERLGEHEQAYQLDENFCLNNEEFNSQDRKEQHDYINMLQLEQTLASNRQMIDQLERELLMKSMMITQIQTQGNLEHAPVGNLSGVATGPFIALN